MNKNFKRKRSAKGGNTWLLPCSASLRGFHIKLHHTNLADGTAKLLALSEVPDSFYPQLGLKIELSMMTIEKPTSGRTEMR